MIIIGEIIIGFFYQQRLVFPPFYEKDDKYGYRLKNSATFMHKDYNISNKVILNKDGFRSFSETDSVDLGKKTILFIGDSFTFGQGVNFENTFVGQISDHYNSFQVINASAPGWGPAQYEKLLFDFLDKKLNVSCVVLGYFPYNDLWDADRSYKDIKIFEGRIVSESTKLSFWKRLKIKLIHKSQILMLVYRLKKSSVKSSKIRGAIQKDSNFSKLFLGDTKILREYGAIAQNKIISMNEVCKRNNIPLFVLVFPSEHGFTERESFYDSNIVDYPFPTKLLTTELQNAGIKAIDFWPLMSRDCYLIQDAHFNFTGHKNVYEKLKVVLFDVL
tara:strand:- start:28 stop:1020 length:993 start_codon:yes stop_codon:yes gene_type:complete